MFIAKLLCASGSTSVANIAEKFITCYGPVLMYHTNAKFPCIFFYKFRLRNSYLFRVNEDPNLIFCVHSRLYFMYSCLNLIECLLWLETTKWLCDKWCILGSGFHVCDVENSNTWKIRVGIYIYWECISMCSNLYKHKVSLSRPVVLVQNNTMGHF